MARAQWGSRVGFILAAAGSAIGLGAIWKFPYVVAQNGGGAFLLLFLVIAFILGISVMAVEMALGAAVRDGPVGTYRKLGGKLWSLCGYANVLCGFCILSFYSVVGGWTIAYFFKSAGGSILVSDPAFLSAAFDSFVTDPVEPLYFHAAFLGATVCVILAGVQKGIEQISKYLMIMLFILMLVLIARGLMLPGAIKAVAVFLQPDFSKMTPSMLIESLGLVFFSLSLGMGVMIAYGSYVAGDAAIFRSAMSVTGLTVVICILAGLMVFPAIFVFGFDPQAGPGLTFITMPAVFSKMAGGYVFALFFFFLLFVAALTSSVSLLEVPVSFFIDEFGLSRKAGTLIAAGVIFFAGIAASLSMGMWRPYTLFGLNFFDLLDAFSSKILLPAGGIAACILGGWKVWPAVLSKLVPAGGKIPAWIPVFRLFCRFAAPALIFVVLVQSFL